MPSRVCGATALGDQRPDLQDAVTLPQARAALAARLMGPSIDV